jgi:hypothetical protein
MPIRHQTLYRDAASGSACVECMRHGVLRRCISHLSERPAFAAAVANARAFMADATSQPILAHFTG